MIKNFFRHFALAVAICIAAGAQAQSLDQAKKLYAEGSYEEAKPAFEKLVWQSPSNPSYNLWYGVCCYETGDYELAEKHLLVANKRDVPDSYRYLADIYTTSYRFAKAVEMWEGYIALMQKKKEDTHEYEQQLAYVSKLLRMKEKMEDVQVIDSIVVDKEYVLSAYFLSEDCGVLERFEDFFHSDDSQSTVYINSKGDQAYYGRPDENGRYALYSQSKLMNDWADEAPVFHSDTSENSYPFVLGDGVTLYFASKGNGSIGGYDLFVTRYKNNDFLAPEQLGMPFNSPANDYLMVIDESKNLGWFVSDRSQPEGKVCVYLFIPDESRKRIAESDDDEWLCRRAILSSIRETWAAGADYSALINKARTDETASATPQRKQDFEFVINDNTTYYTLNDFKNAEARGFYQKAESVLKQIRDTELKLNESRDKYTAGNTAVRNQLKPTILKAEYDLAALYSQYGELTKKARNTELRVKN
jgi:hypothetical protein